MRVCKINILIIEKPYIKNKMCPDYSKKDYRLKL